MLKYGPINFSLFLVKVKMNNLTQDNFCPCFGEKSKDVYLADIKFPLLSKLLPASERPNSIDFNLNKGVNQNHFGPIKHFQ